MYALLKEINIKASIHRVPALPAAGGGRDIIAAAMTTAPTTSSSCASCGRPVARIRRRLLANGRLPVPAAPDRQNSDPIICAAQSDVGTRLAAQHGDNNFCGAGQSVGSRGAEFHQVLHADKAGLASRPPRCCSRRVAGDIATGRQAAGLRKRKFLPPHAMVGSLLVVSDRADLSHVTYSS